MSSFVERLGTRVLAPSEVSSPWGLPDYVETLLEDDAGDVEDHLRRETRARRRTDPDRVLALLAALARPTGAELNLARLSRGSGIPVTTLPPYVDLLVDLGLIQLLPGASHAVVKRAVARPRALFTAPSLATRLADLERTELLELSGRRHLLPLLLNLVATQLLDQAGGSAVPYRVCHLRERNGLQVDLLVELDDESLYAVEVRTASSFRPHQFRRIEALASRAGSRLRAGIVLNTAPRGHVFGPGLWALPISAVWDPDHVGVAGHSHRWPRLPPRLRR